MYNSAHCTLSFSLPEEHYIVAILHNGKVSGYVEQYQLIWGIMLLFKLMEVLGQKYLVWNQVDLATR